MQQIRQRDIAPVFLNQRGLAVLARAPALRAIQPHHGGRVFNKAERSVGHWVMLLAGAGDPQFRESNQYEKSEAQLAQSYGRALFHRS
jgi:hypothetical protein